MGLEQALHAAARHTQVASHEAEALGERVEVRLAGGVGGGAALKRRSQRVERLADSRQLEAQISMHPQQVVWWRHRAEMRRALAYPCGGAGHDVARHCQ